MSRQTIGDILNFVSQSLGIGTTNPKSLLDVYGTINTITSVSSNLNIYGSAFITNSIGIGTTIPRKTLDIEGDINIGGTIYQNNSVYISSQWTSNIDESLYYLNSVGIGTTSPITTLDVGGTIRGTALTGSLITDTINTISSTIAASATAVKSAFDNGSNAILSTNSRVLKAGDTMSGDLIVNANIGINTATPVSSLHVEGLGYISSNVGIGTTFAKKTLDIQGDINFAGSLYQNNSLYISSQWTSNNVTNSLYYLGSVGIGSTQPRVALDVSGTISGTNLTINNIITSNLTVLGTETIVNTYTTYTSNLRIDNQLGDGPALVVLQKGVGNQYAVADFYDRDVSSTIPALRVAEGANIGIGTATPQQQLHVQGNVYASESIGIGTTQPVTALDVTGGVRLKGNNATTYTFGINGMPVTGDKGIWFDYDTTNNYGKIQVEQQGTAYRNLAINVSGGNVGIGTTSALDKLYVYGNLRVGDVSTGYRVQFIGDGTGGGPRINFGTDADPGAYLSIGAYNNVNNFDNKGTRQFAIRNNGVETIRVNAGGNVGIGSITPLQLLHVQGNVYASGSIGIGSTQPIGSLDISGTTFTTSIGIGTKTALVPLHIQGNAYASGRIGIGTTNPSGNLHIYAPTNQTISIESIAGTRNNLNLINRNNTYDSENNINFQNYDSVSTNLITQGQISTYNTDTYKGLQIIAPQSDGNIQFLTNGYLNVRMHIKPDGNIGIGTTNPLQLLHIQGSAYTSGSVGIGTTISKKTLDVQGDINFAGSLYQNNSLYISSQWTSNNTTNSLYYSGSVGIGSTQPISALDVNGTVIGKGLVIDDRGGNSAVGINANGSIEIYNSGNPFIDFKNAPADDFDMRIGLTNGTDFYLRTGGAGNIIDAMRVTGQGNVGIGTTVPLRTLDVNGLFQSTNYKANHWLLAFYTGGSTARYIKIATSLAGTSGSLGGELIITGNVGGWDTTATATFDISIGLRSATLTTTIKGNVNAYNLNTVIGYADFALYRESDNSYSIYLKVIGYYNINFFIYGASGYTLVNPNATYIDSPTGTLINNSILTSLSQTISGNNIGIGTALPNHKLHIYSASTTDNDYESAGILLDNATAGETAIAFRNSNVNAGGNIWFMGLNSNSTRFDIGYGTQSSQLDDASVDMCIDTNGNVGIGVTTPSTTLDIGGGSLYINTTPSYQLFTSSDKIFQQRSSIQSVISLLSDQNTNGATLGGLYFGRTQGQGDAHINLGGIRGIQHSTGVNSGLNLAFIVKGGGASYEALRISGANSYVGIGTTNPSHKLHIYSTSVTDNNYESTGILLDNATAGETAIAFRNSNVNVGGNIWFMGLNSNSTRFDIGYGVQTTQLDDASVDMCINTSGNVGIGTTNPLSRLHIINGKIGVGLFPRPSSTVTNLTPGALLELSTSTSSTSGTLDLLRFYTTRPWVWQTTDTDNTIVFKSEGQGKYFEIRASDNSIVSRFYAKASGQNNFAEIPILSSTTFSSTTIKNTGSIGIGTTTPLQKLDVYGNATIGNGQNGSSSSTVGGPFFKQVSWDAAAPTHTLTYPVFCIGDNSAGTLHIQVSNKLTTGTHKIGTAQYSFIKCNDTATDIFENSYHRNTNLTNFSVTTSGNDIVVSTDSDCSISWTSIGSY